MISSAHRRSIKKRPTLSHILTESIRTPKLKEIELVTAEIGNAHYDRRVPVRSPDEIGDLASAINRMASELANVEWKRQSLQQARKDLFANISHELRTPLTAIIGFIEALQDMKPTCRSSGSDFTEPTASGPEAGAVLAWDWPL